MSQRLVGNQVNMLNKSVLHGELHGMTLERPKKTILSNSNQGLVGHTLTVSAWLVECSLGSHLSLA